MTLCSNCSAEVKPIVAFDIDGTLTHYHRGLYRMIVDYYGITDPREDDWDGQGNFEDWMGLTRDAYRDAKLAFRQGGFKRWSEPQDGLDLLYMRTEQLRAADEVEVWITTTRPWNRMDNVDPDTKHWLKLNFPCFDHLLYGDDKYTQLAQIVDPMRVVMIVDDLPELYFQARESFGWSVPLLVERPHNEHFRTATLEGSTAFTVKGLAETAMFMEKRVEQWHRLVDNDR